MAILAQINRDADLAEYKDFGGGVYRAASFSGDRIETCLFIGPARDAGDWNVVKGLFAADTLGTDQRRMLLSGKSADGLANAGPIVCACFGVGRNTICDTIAGGARSAADIGDQAESGHQLRLLHSGAEAADRADRRERSRAAEAGGGELELSAVLAGLTAPRFLKRWRSSRRSPLRSAWVNTQCGCASATMMGRPKASPSR